MQTIIPLENQGALRLTTARYYTSEASLHGHLKNEREDTNGKEEELGSSSYVNPAKTKDTQLVYALDFLRGVDSLASDATKTKAEHN